MRWIVALALLFAVTPGMTEVAEGVVHAFGHGDLPHHDKDDQGCGDEHTCTALFHACGCHSAMSAQTSSLIPTPGGVRHEHVALALALADSDGRANEPPPLRPPITT